MRRRWFLGRLFAAAVAASMLVGAAGASGAESDWCAEDPIFNVDGVSFAVTSYWPAVNADQVSSVAYVVDVPWDARVSYVVPPGQPVPATVTWNRQSRERDVVVHATVNARGSFVTKAVLDPARGSDVVVFGVANRSIDISIPTSRPWGR